MTTVTTPIIPVKQNFAKVNAPHKLNLEAICAFVAIGFFLDEDTYWKDQVVLRPACTHSINPSMFLKRSEPWFTWHYTPQDITFNEALEEFTFLFESIIKKQTQGKRVILPLSGGLDSRTMSTALYILGADVTAYSYQFENGYPEAKIAKRIAESCGFDFSQYVIPRGYLWDHIDELVEINQCYSDFTSPRQMAVVNELENKGELFSLGHWGDVLFDSMNLPHLSEEQQIDILFNKLLKRGGLQLATDLWEAWGLKGNFKIYFRGRITELLQSIPIEDTNARLRAFKSLYWAPRWTSINLSIFEKHHCISLPYYHDSMCKFICTVPEQYLNNRQLQIAYIKKRTPKLAKITWQDQRPFNLNTYHLNTTPFNLPYKVCHKVYRTLKSAIGKSYTQRNWELQFLGKDNSNKLKECLFNNDLESLVPKDIIERYFTNFRDKDTLNHAHAINMLVVLSKFNETQNHE